MKPSVRSLVAPALLLVVTGCASVGAVSGLREKLMAISPGDSKEHVLTVLGTPGDRSFKGSDEAWQYCSTGVMTDTYATIWMTNGVVHGLTTQDAAYVNGSCAGGFPSVDWGQRPSDVIVETRNRDD